VIYSHCVACGKEKNLFQHHLVPRSKGGSDEKSNLITLCGSCHAKAHAVQAMWDHKDLTKAALQAKKAQGERVGAIPYGYYLDANGVDLHPDPVEQDVIRQARELQSSGLSLRKIAAELQRRGKVSRNGATFQATQIQRMVACETIDRLLLSCCSLLVAHLQFSGE